MPVNIPAAVNLHRVDPDSDKRSNIGAPSSVAIKAAGNLPLTQSAGQFRADTNGVKDGILWSMPSVNVSSDTKILVWSWQYNAPNRIEIDTLANSGTGIRIGSGSGSTNYKDFDVVGNDTPYGSSQAGPVPVVIDLNASGEDASSGTYDNTDVQAYGLYATKATMSNGAYAWMFAQRCHIFDTAKNAANIVKFTGTSDLDDIITAVLGNDFTDKIGNWAQQLSTTYFIPVAFQVGDTSTATNFDCSGKTIVSPANKDTKDPRYRLTTQATRVYFALRDNAADDADLTNSTWVWGVASPFDLDISNLSSINASGAVFNGMGDFTVGTSVSGAANFNLAPGSSVIINGANINGSTVNGDLILNTSTDLANITVNGDLRIQTGADSTITLSNVNVAGNVLNDSAGDTLTLASTNGSILTTTEPGTGNGQVNIVNTVNITVTGIPAGAEWRLYEKDPAAGIIGTVELAGAESKPSGADIVYAHNYTSDQEAYLQVIEPGYEEFGLYFTIGASAQTITVSLQVDTNV